MVNPGELSLTAVTLDKPKVLRGLSQNGNVAGARVPVSLAMGAHTLPVDREDLTHPVAAAEHDKPVALPRG